MSASEELHVAWSPPGGETPPQCLEYEVQLAEDHGEANAAWAVGTTGRGRGGELCLRASSGATAENWGSH